VISIFDYSDPDVLNDLVKIENKCHSWIRREIERQLAYQPELETKNRNPLLRTSTLGSAWELRFGPENQFRVFDRTEAERRQVHIFAVGMKVKERLFVGGKEFDL